jgi:hypothetical protein
MPENVRALIVVCALSISAFYIVQPLTTSVILPREFAVWKKVWLGSTIVAFLTPDFFLFAAIVPLICLYARSYRAASVALFFLLLFAVPLGNQQIGGLGLFISLFGLNNARLLAIVLLLPILLASRSAVRRNISPYEISDLLVVSYVLLTIAERFDDYSASQIMRLGTLQTLDVLIPYFAFSRVVSDIADIKKVLLAIIVAVLPLAMIAVFETLKSWDLYSVIKQEWGGTVGYLRRDGWVRASASSNEPIVLGFIIMVAIGCMLAVSQSTVLKHRFSYLVFAILGVGLFATFSRGPWVGSVVLVLSYLALGPNPIANLSSLAVVGTLAMLPVLLSPIGDRLLNLLPFIGSVDVASVTYRERLFDNAIIVIERNLWFGSTDYISAPEMKVMVQGEQIIDVVNSYLEIALKFGVVGLGLFLACFVTILIGLWRVLKTTLAQEVEINVCTRALMATLLAILVTIATVSPVDFIPYVYWSIAGLSVALIRVAYKEKTNLPRAGTLFLTTKR